MNLKLFVIVLLVLLTGVFIEKIKHPEDSVRKTFLLVILSFVFSFFSSYSIELIKEEFKNIHNEEINDSNIFREQIVSENESSNSFISTDKKDIIEPSVTKKDIIPEDAVFYDSSYYKMYNKSIDWNEAVECCKKLGGHLVTITSQEEQDFINQFIDGAEKRSYWIGLSNNNEKMEWQWVNFENYDYCNWANHEPNNGMGGTEFYVAIVSHDTVFDYEVNLGEWNDHRIGADDNFGFICEWDN